MCGIAGFVTVANNLNINNDILRNMVNSLSHRGPDDEGMVNINLGASGLKGVFLGHRRLKIIDLSLTGHQPMFNGSKTLCITYNGEIYNYIEIRKELINKGYRFKSTSDTEVILNAYQEWGVDCFAKFNGMWALAILDNKKKKVILSRDRFGKKPLYYYKSADEFVFASEIKALLKYPSVKSAPNYGKIFRYLSTNYRYVDIDNESYFANIFQVPKSSFLEINESLNLNIKQYWRLSIKEFDSGKNEQDVVQGFRDLLIDSVRLRLRSDVPVGCMLSGGLDSTSIACIAYKILKQPIIAFSGITGAEKRTYDESDYINKVIEETRADFHYIRPDPEDIFKTVDEMLGFHDEPICTVTWYSLYLIAKKVKNEKTPVLLNGHGGDELTAGYWDYYHYNFYDLESNGQNDDLKKEINDWKINHGRDINEIDRYKDYTRRLANLSVSEKNRFPDYSDIFLDELKEQYLQDIKLEQPEGSLLNKRLYSDLMYETIPPSLRAEDRNTMAHSIESRSPWLDYRLAEYCFSLPSKFKIRNGLGKWIVRESMKGILPEDVRMRKDKSGFIAPADEWFRTINRKQLSDLVHSGSFIKRKLFKLNKIEKILTEHLEADRNHQMFLWQLINLEIWFRKFFDAQ